MQWKPYDPAWLVELARRQHPGELWLAEALARCTRAWEESRAYTRFVPAEHPNEPGSEWQFDRSVLLEHPAEGTLVLDVLQDGRIGGIEFLRRL
jgi:hypothetical protein